MRGIPTPNKYRSIPKTYHRENFGAITIDWDQPDPQISLQVLDVEGNEQIGLQLKLSQLKLPRP